MTTWPACSRAWRGGQRPPSASWSRWAGTRRRCPPSASPVRRVGLARGALPLAAARNAGRRAASGERLVFLDVDCIPCRRLVAVLAAAVAEADGLVCGAIRYLPAGAVRDGWTEGELERLGRLHPRPPLPRVRGGARPGTPACSGRSPSRCGPRPTTGSGASTRATTATGPRTPTSPSAPPSPACRCCSPAARRPSTSTTPPATRPLQHFADIVRNARRFRARHGTWPMEGWLDAFADRGLVARDRERDLVVLRPPSPGEVAAARLPPWRPF